MTNQKTSSKQKAQQVPIRTLTEIALSGLHLRGGASARSQANDREKTFFSDPTQPRINEQDLWLMAIGRKPATPENIAKIVIQPSESIE